MDYLPNRLTGESKLPPGAFFFVYDYWAYDEGEDKFRSLSDGSVMPEPLSRRYLGYQAWIN